MAENQTILFIDNGGSYSDFGVIGAVICIENDRDTIGKIVTEAVQKYDIIYSAHEKIRDQYIEDHPGTTWREWEAAIGAFPDRDDVFSEVFKNYGFTYVPYKSDFEVL